ncbi:unnamed protein product [Clonostachys rosea f. rosea IK726]|uniref:DUF7924 domain-containing protein n=2 Tax=Bionectria ochroleuca TaxID=29856 RepID=A0A0B7K9I1_BIOOC|nr:unnamed protein product [Clonostachys rosea f. rosea IK726]
MAHTRVQSATQKGRASSTTKDQENPTRERSNYDQPHPYPAKKILSQQDSPTPGNGGTKRRVGALDHDFDSSPKRPRRSPRLCHIEDPSDRPNTNNCVTYEPITPIEFWARQGQCPQEYFKFDMEHLLARKKSLSSLGRKRSNSTTSTTPSDQKPREEKSAPYRDPRYKTLLATKGSFMDKSDLAKKTSFTLLSAEQATPNESVFRDDLFEQTCRSVEDRNEARVLRDITPLVVPSAEILAIYGSTSLKCLIESVNEGWNNSIPLTGTRPQPDYSAALCCTLRNRYGAGPGCEYENQRSIGFGRHS